MKINIGPYLDHDDESDRIVEIQIDNYDLWNLDHTLALIIHPVLIQLKQVKTGSPRIDMDDVPENLRCEVDPINFGNDTTVHERYDWVLSEMIWSFEQILDDGKTDMELFRKDRPEWEAYNLRIKNGLMLFGKYFRGLWD